MKVKIKFSKPEYIDDIVIEEEISNLEDEANIVEIARFELIRLLSKMGHFHLIKGIISEKFTIISKNDKLILIE